MITVASEIAVIGQDGRAEKVVPIEDMHKVSAGAQTQPPMGA
jgi:hypothetical protein